MDRLVWVRGRSGPQAPGPPDVPPCEASCPRSEWEEEEEAMLVWDTSSWSPNLNLDTPATCGELLREEGGGREG